MFTCGLLSSILFLKKRLSLLRHKRGMRCGGDADVLVVSHLYSLLCIGFGVLHLISFKRTIQGSSRKRRFASVEGENTMKDIRHQSKWRKVLRISTNKCLKQHSFKRIDKIGEALWKSSYQSRGALPTVARLHNRIEFSSTIAPVREPLLLHLLTSPLDRLACFH